MNFFKPLVKAVFFTSFFFIASPSFAQSSPQVLTLDDCIKTALKKATSVQTAENSLTLSGAQVLQSYGSFLPTASVTARYTPYSTSKSIQQTATTSGVITPLLETQTHSASYSITSTLNIFNGFSDIAALKQSLNNEQASTFSLKRAKEQIAFDVSQAYLQVLLNQELLRIAKENLNSSKDQLRKTSEQAKIGARPIADLYQQEATVSTNESSVITAENTLRNSKIVLLQRLRIDPSGEYTFTEPETDTTRLGSEYQDINLLTASALEKRSDIKSSEQSLKAYDWAVTQAWSGYYPQLNLNFSFGSSGLLIDNQTLNGVELSKPNLPGIWDQLKNQYGTSISANLTWTIFDGFLTNSNIQQAKVNYLNSKLNSEDLRIEAIAQVKQAVGDYNAADQQLETSRKGLISAEKAFETVQERYRVGAATFVELAASRAALVQAQSSRAQAIYNFTFQKKALAFYLGSINIDSYLQTSDRN
ncbi:MAG: TolC family protein [Chlorobiales bacterium]|nr:TolC family protein [Chlorobiales bacterium]